MNHLQIFKYIQSNPDLFSYELRALVRNINNEPDLEKMANDLRLALKFIEEKRKDEAKYCTKTDNEVLMLLECS